MKKLNVLLALAICTSLIVIPSVASQGTPFPIHGYVFSADGTPYMCPNITITNLNTKETFQTMTLSGSNYYRVNLVPLVPNDVKIDDVLRFEVMGDGESAIGDYTIVPEMNVVCLNITMKSGGIEEQVPEVAGTIGEQTTDGKTDVVKTPEAGKDVSKGAETIEERATPETDANEGEETPVFSFLVCIITISFVILLMRRYK